MATALRRPEAEVSFPEGATLCTRDAAHPGRDACSGDSGGPLSLDLNGTRVQAGIISYGPGCGLRESVGVYTSIGYYEDWIRRHVPDAVFISAGGASAAPAAVLPRPDCGTGFPEAQGRVTVTIGEGPRLRDGTLTHIGVASSAVGQLVVFNLDRTTCRAKLLHPLDARVPPDRWATLGTRIDIPGMGRRIRVQRPFGPNRVYALILPAVAHLSDLLPLELGRGAAVDGTALFDRLSTGLRARGFRPLASGSTDYEIVPP